MQTKSTIWILPLAVAAMLGTTGCMSTSDRSTGRVMDDHSTSSRVKSALNHDPVYKYEDVAIKTYNGVVQLNGWATTSDQVQRAGEIAERVDGVSGVINHISIKRVPTGRKDGYPYPRPDDPNWRPNAADQSIRSTESPPPTSTEATPTNPDLTEEPLPPPPNK